MDAQEYAVKLTADIKQFTQNMRSVTQQLSFTDKQAQTFSRNLQKAMGSSSPEVQKLGRDMQNLSKQYTAQIEAFQMYASEVGKAGDKLQGLIALHQTQSEQIRETEAKLQELGNAYGQAAQELEVLKAAHDAGTKINANVWMEAKKKVDSAREAYENMNAVLNEQKDKIGITESAMDTWSSTAQDSAAEAANLADAAGLTKNEMMNMSSQVGNITGIGDAFKMVSGKASVLLNFVSKLTKTGFGALGSAVKNTTKKFREFHLNSNALSNAVKKLTRSFGSFYNLLVRRLKRQVISSIFNGIKEGLQNVAKENAAFNTAISSMASSLKTFINALGGAFAPLVQIAAPYITQFINFLTDTVGKVGQLIAGITGKDTYMKAIPVQYDYAKSLEETAKSSDKANKSAKAYEKTVMSFDQLHKLNGKDETTSDTAGTTGTAKANAFEIAPVGSKIKGIADEIANAFKAHDWAKLGQLLADGVNKAFAWVDNIVKWENCGAKITEICNGIIGTFNSFVQNLDWGLIGQTFGDGVNTIINSILLLENGIDWTALGNGLGTGVQSFLDTVHWEDVGKAFIGGIQAMLETVNGFISSKNEDGESIWHSFGKALKDGFTGAVDELSPTEWGETLAKLVNGIFETMKVTFSDTEKWAELGQKLAENVNTFFKDLNTDEVADGINNFVDALLALAKSFIEKIDWQEIGTKIGELISKIDWMDVLKIIGIVLIPFLIAQIPALLLSALGGPIGVAVVAIGAIILALIIKNWDKIKEWAKQLPDKIKNWFDARGNDIKNWWEGVKKWADEKLNNAKKAIADTFAGIKKNIEEKAKAIKDNVKDAFDKIKKHIEEPIEKAKKTLESTVQRIKSAINFEGIASKVKSAFDGIRDAICSPFEAAWNTVKPIIDAIKNFQLPSWVTDNPITNAFSGGGSSVIDIGGYATGGFPEDGLFMANHGELVGQFSNGRTAVVNNSQIIEGVTRGVRQGVMDAMSRYNNRNNSGGGDIVLFVGEEELARATMRGEKKLNKRYSPSIAFS